jgi:hypothetical protein
MANAERSIEANTELAAGAGAAHNARVIPFGRATDACRRQGGRPPKLGPETLERLRAAVAQGLGIEDAARSAGLGKSTVHKWTQTGKQVLATRSEDPTFSDHEQACRDLVIALRQAEAEYRASLRAMLVTAATNHRKTKTTLRLGHVVVKNEILRDENGEILMVPTYTSEVTVQADVRAIIELHKRGFERALKDRTRESNTSASEDDVDPSAEPSVTRRLAESIHLVRDQMHEDFEDFEAKWDAGSAPALGMTPRAWADAGSDDDGIDYEYAFWEPSLNAEIAPETPETPETQTPEESP